MDGDDRMVLVVWYGADGMAMIVWNDGCDGDGHGAGRNIGGENVGDMEISQQ